MPKKQTTPTKSKKSWLKYGLLTLLAFVVMGFVAYSGYQAQQEKTEANRFAALQSDFKKLQAEFNKIDPGWEYSEGCVANGSEFSPKSDVSCSVHLVSKSVQAENGIKNSVERYVDKVARTSGFTGVSSQTTYDEDGKTKDELSIKRKEVGRGGCNMAGSLIEGKTVMTLSFTCGYDAKKVHFPETNR